MTPAIGYVLAGLFAAAPLVDSASPPRSSEVVYECPSTYRLATLRGEIVCLRYRTPPRR